MNAAAGAATFEGKKMRIKVFATIILSCMLAATVSRADVTGQPDGSSSQPNASCETTTADGQERSSADKKQDGNDRTDDAGQDEQDDPGSSYMNQVELRS